MMCNNIAIVAATSNYSVLTLAVSDQGIFSYQTGFAPLNSFVSFRGEITPSPIQPVPVYLNFTGPSQRTFQSETLTDASGEYNLDLNATFPGIWTVQSYWRGNPDYHGAASTPREFAIAEPMKLQVTGLSVRGLTVDPGNPTIEVKPSENITASFTILTGDTYVNTNVFVIAFDSWEPDKWVIMSFQWGLTAEPLYYKPVYVAPIDSLGALDNFQVVQRNTTSGRFETNVTFDLPLAGTYYREIYTTPSQSYGNTGEAPSFIAPSTEGTYYIGFLMSEMQSAQSLVREQNLWRRSPAYFESLVQWNRTLGYLQFVRVIVVDVDPYMRSAYNAIVNATAAGLNVSSAEAAYTNAEESYGIGNYTRAKAEAQDARSLAIAALQEFGGQIRSRGVLDAIAFLLVNYGVATKENRQLASLDYTNMNQYLTSGDYGQARHFELDLQRIAAWSLGSFFAYLFMLWFGVGEIASHMLGRVVYDPVGQLQKLVHWILKTRLRKYHTLLSVLLIFFPAQVAQEILSSGFPPIGSLVLAGAVVGGWRYPTFNLHLKLKKRKQDRRHSRKLKNTTARHRIARNTKRSRRHLARLRRSTTQKLTTKNH